MRRIKATRMAGTKFHKMVDEIRAFRPDADYRFSLPIVLGYYL